MYTHQSLGFCLQSWTNSFAHHQQTRLYTLGGASKGYKTLHSESLQIGHSPCSTRGLKVVPCLPIMERGATMRGIHVSPQRLTSRSSEHISMLRDSGCGAGHNPRSCMKCAAKGEVGEYPMSKLSGQTQEEEEETFTVEDAIKGLGFGTFQGLLLVYAGMAWAAEAMEMMLLSFVGPAVKDLWDLSPREESSITSAVFVGMMIGAYSWGFLSDAKGRRVGFFATSVLTFIAGLLSAFSNNYLVLLGLRFIVGIGLAGGPVISTWFMEFVPSANRGLWMIVMTIFWTLGSVFEALLAWGIMPGLGWRWLLGVSSIPLAILLLFYPLVPESPRYLASKGEKKRATDVLKRMAQLNKKPLPAGILVSSEPVKMDSKHADQEKTFELEQDHFAENEESEFEGDPLIQTLTPTTNGAPPSQQQEPSTSTSTSTSGSTELQIFSQFSHLLSSGIRKSTLLIWSVFFANSFTYYGIVLLSTQLTGGADTCGGDASGHPATVNPADASLYRDVLITSVAELPGLAVAAGVVDVYGRKRSMTALFTLCGVFVLPLLQHQSEAVTTGLLFGARASIMGAFTILTIYAPELYPTGMRSAGLGVASAFGRIGGFLCPLVAVELVQSCQQSLSATLFAVVPVTAGVLVMNFPTETKGRALSDE